MKILDTILVGLSLAGAAFMLYRAFKPRNKGGSCGCGSTGCKMPRQETRKPTDLNS